MRAAIELRGIRWRCTEDKRGSKGLMNTQDAIASDPNAIFAAGAAILEASLEPATWRLIVDQEARSGPANMALDQAIAEACAAGESPSTIRFYRWSRVSV